MIYKLTVKLTVLTQCTKIYMKTTETLMKSYSRVNCLKKIVKLNFWIYSAIIDTMIKIQNFTLY